jgi:hypothetical protein
MFFNRPDFDLASAQPPTFALCPDGAMVDDLRQDYRAMSVMIFGEPPEFYAVIEAIACRFPLRSDPVFPSRIDPGDGMSRRASFGSSW